MIGTMRWLTVASILLSASFPWVAVRSQVPGEAAGHNPKTAMHRYQYPTDGPVPNGVALRTIAQMASERPRFASMAMANYIGYDGHEAANLVQYLASLHEDLTTERQELEVRLACSRPIPSGEAAYRLMDLLDDIRFNLYDKYYILARAELGADQSQSLQRLLDEVKDGISVNVLDHTGI